MDYLPPSNHSPYHYTMLTKHRLFLLVGAVVSILFVFLAAFLTSQRTSFTGRAQTSGPTVFSRENSYLFASPITAAANGTSLIRVTVFLLNDQGLGVVGQKVELSVNGPVTVAQTQPVSDTFGRAIFDVTAGSPGDYTITAATSGVPLLQKVSVSFH